MNKYTMKRIRRRLLSSVTGMIGNLGLSQPALTVLTYHSFSYRHDIYSVSPETFASHMETVARTARFVTPEEVRDVVEGKRKVTERGVLVTIDDGYKDVFSVLPVIKKHSIPVVLFVLGDSVHANRKELDHPGKLLTRNDIRILAREGCMIGCHSMTHTEFTELDPDGIYREVTLAKRIIEHEVGNAVLYFAYPKGKYTTDCVQAVKYAGYDMAFSVGHGCIPARVSKFAVPRVVIDSSYTADDISFVLSPITAQIRALGDKVSRFTAYGKPALVRRRFI